MQRKGSDMETSIKNKFKAFTSIEQSKKLAKILPHESADMCYNDGELRIGYAQLAIERDDYFPCWSLDALLEIIHKDFYIVLDHDGITWTVAVRHHDNRDIKDLVYTNEPIDSCVEMIVKLKEKGLI